jgi:hypothetical protein
MEKIKAYRDDVTGRWFMDGVEDDKLTYAKIIDDLKSHKAFKFSRFGDGEWNCIFNKKGTNCDGHQYFPSLGESLRRIILSEPNYTVGIQPLSMSYERTEQIKEFCKGLNINWVNSDILHNASIDGQLDKFIEAIQGRYVIIVGPPHLASFFETNVVHIVIPSKDCWLVYEEIRQQIEFHIDGVNNAVVLLAASMMSEVIIDDFADHHHTFIDIGSVLDPYCNVKSRRYHYKLKI